MDLQLATGGIINVSNTGGRVVLASLIKEDAGETNTITKTGAGTLVISGTNVNSWGGGVVLNAGVLQLNKASALGSVSGLGLTINGGSLDNGSGGAITLSNYAQTWGGNFSFIGTTNLNLGAGAVNLTGTRTVTVSNNALTVGGTITNTGGITKAGAGTLILNGANTYSGTTTVSAGTLALGNTNALQNSVLDTGISGSQIVTFAVGGNNTYNIGGLTGGDELAIGGNTLSVGSAGGTGTYSGVISGSGGAFTKVGSGTVILSGNNSYTGATTVSAGTLLLNGTNTSTTVTINSGGTLGGSGSVGAVTVNSGGVIDPGNSPGNLSVSGLTLNGGGSYRWEITDATGAAGTGWDVVTVGSGSGGITLNANSGSQFTINVTGSSVSNFLASNSYAWDIMDAGSWSTAFDASAFLINTNNFSASGTLGTWSVANNSGNLRLLYTAPVLSSVYTWNTGSGEWTSGGNWAGSAAPTNGSSIVFAGSSGGASTNNAQVSTMSGLTFSNTAGSYTLSGSAFTNSAAGIVNNSASAQTISNDITLGAAQSFNAAAGNLTFAGAINNDTNLLTVAGSSNTVINGVVSGSGGLTKAGTGSLSLGGNNSFTGALTVNEGPTLVNGIQATTTVNVSGGTLLLGASDLLANGATLALTAGTVNFGGFTDTLTTFNQSGGVFTNGTVTATTYGLSGGTIAGNLGTGTINVTGSTALNGTANAGTINVSGGTLTLGSASRFTGTTPAVTVSGGATLALGGVETLGSIAGAGAVNLGAFTLTAGSANTSTTFSGAISGSGGLTKVGNATLTLTGVNTYTGTTTVSAGELSVSNNTSSTVDIASGATFSMNAAQTLSGISGLGTINMGTNGLTFSNPTGSNSTFAGVIAGTAALTKSGFGTLTLNGNNTFTGAINANAGVISVDKDAELGNSANDIVFGGGTLQSTASFAMAAGRDISGTGTLDIAAGTALTNSGTVNMTSLTLGNTGTFAMSGASKTLSGLTFSAASTLTNTGVAAVIDGNVAANNASGTVVMAGAYDLGTTSRIFTVSNGSATTDMQITGSITNTNSGGYLVKAGTGRLEISGVNTGMLGSVQIGVTNAAAAGEVLIGNKDALGLGQFRLNSGTLMSSTALTGANAITNSVSLGGRGSTPAILGGTNAIEFSGPVGWFAVGGSTSALRVDNTTTFTGVVSNSTGSSINLSGSGTLTLSGASANTFANTLNVGSGLTVVAGKNGALGTTAAGTVVDSGGTLVLSNVTYSTAEGLTISGMGVGGNGALRGAGTSSFAGAVTAGAATTIAADSGAAFTISGALNAGGFTVTAGGDGNLLLSGAVSNGNIAKTGAGSFTLSNASSSFGTLTTGPGTTTFATNATITGLAGSGALNLAGGTLTVNSSTAESFSGAITGAGGLTKSSAGTLTLSGAGSYSGATVVSGGTLLAGTNNVFSANSAFTVGSAGVLGILDLNGTTQTVTNLTLLGSSASGRTNRVEIGAGGTLTVNGTVQYETGEIGNWPGQINGGTLDLGGATRTFLVYSNDNSTTGGDLQVSSVIANGGINKTQNGILRLSGANTLAGTVTLSAGELQLYNTNALQNATLDMGAAGNQFVSFNTNGTFTYNIGALAGADNLALGANRISVGSNNASTTYSGILSGTGGLNKVGTGTFTLSGANSYSGGTVVSGGRLVGSTATLQGPITNTAAVTFNQSTNGTYGGVLSGADGTLTKSGLGTLTLTNNNTFTGATTIDAGRLVVNGTNASSAVTVQAGASLGGAGRVGNLTIGGLVAPGNSVGTVTAGDTVLSPGGLFELEIYNFTGTAGTDWDLLAAGNLNLSSLSSSFTINLISMSSPSAAGSAINFNQNLSFTNTFLSYTGLTGTFDSSLFTVNTNGFGNPVNGSFSVTDTGSGLALLYTTAFVPPSDYIWNTNSGAWNNEANWVNLAAPTNGTTIVFSGPGGDSTNNAVTSIVGLTFSNGAGSYTLSGNAMTNGSGGIVNNSTNAQTISSELVLGAAQSFNAAAGGLTFSGAVSNTSNNLLTIEGSNNTVISGNLSGAGGVTKLGTGSLTLGGTNSFSGALTASGGTVLVTGSQGTTNISVAGGTLALGASHVLTNNASLTLSSGSVDLGGFSDTVGTYTQSAGTITNGSLAATTYSLTGGTMGASLNGGAVVIGGSLTLSGTITNGASVNLTNGTVTFTAADRLGNDVSVTNSGGTLNLGGFSDTVGTYTQSAGTITNGSLAATTYNLTGGTMGASLNGGAVVIGGSLTLSGAITNGASVNLTNGTVTFTAADRIGSDVTVTNSGGTLNLGGFSDTVGTYTQSAGTITNGSLAATTYSLTGGTMGAGLNGGAVTVGGNVSLSGTITNGASLNITNGTLTYGSANRLGDNLTVTNSGGILNLATFSDTVSTYTQSSGTITNGTLTATTYNLNGGTMGATLSGGTADVGGTVVLSGTITNSALNINTGGTLTLGSANRISDTNAVTVNGGTLAMTNLNDTVGSLVLTNNGLITGTGILTASNYTLNGGTVAANLGAGTATALSGTNTINGNLGGALTASGGTVNLSGTVAGNVTVSGGTVNLGSADRIGATSAVAVSSGALNLNGNDSVASVQITGGSITGSGVLTATSNYDVQGGTISAAIGGSAAMTKSGAATATISGNNSTYSGAVTVGSGALLAANNNAFGTAAITVTNGSTLAANGVSLANNFTIGGQGSVVTNATTNTFTAYWNFGTNAGNASATTTTGTGIAFGSVSVTNNSGANVFLTNNSASSGYTGASGSYNAGANVLAGARSNSSTYFTFTLTADSGYQLSLTNLSFGARSTGSGPVLATVMSSLDSYAAALATNGLTANSSWSLITPTVTASALTNGAVTFRIYGSGGTGGSSSANWRIDDLDLFGYTVTNSLTTNAASGSGTLGISEAGTATFSGNIVNNNAATLTAASGGTATFSGNISGAGALTKTGAGTVTLSGSNSFSGGVTATAGVLRAATNSALGTGLVTVSNGASLVGADGVTLTNRITIGTGGATLGMLEGGTNYFNNTISNNSTATTDAAILTAALTNSVADFTWASFTGAGSNNIILTGLGQVKLGAGPSPAVDFNTFAGTFDASRGGSFTVAANTAITSAKFNLASNSVIEFVGNTTASGKITVATGSTGRLSVASNATVTYSGELSKNGSILELAGGTHVVNGSITGTNENSDLYVIGSTVTLNSQNSYNGPTYVTTGGTLNNGTNNALPTGQVLFLGNAADSAGQTNTYNLNGWNQTLSAAVNGGATNSVNLITNSSGTAANLILSNNSTSQFLNNLRIGGTNLTLTKAGANTLTIGSGGYGSYAPGTSGTNAIAPGTIAIQQGTLLLGAANQISDSTAITMSGGTLDTAGKGDRVGILSVTANSEIANINKADQGPNFVFSGIDLSTFVGGSGPTLNFLGTWARNDVINLFAGNLTGTTGINDFVSKVQFGNSGYRAQIGFNGKTGDLAFTTLTAIPEPKVYVAAGILALLIGYTEYRRRRKIVSSKA